MRQQVYSTGALALFCAAALLYGEEADRVLAPVPVEVQRAHMTTWTNYCTVTMDQLADFQPLEVSLGKYGGRTDRREAATGFFHAMKVDGRWILVDPEGYHFFGVGLNWVTPWDTGADSRYAFREKFGSHKKWAEETYRLLTKELGFNTIGILSDSALFAKHDRPMPSTIYLGIIGSFAKKKDLYMPSYGSTNLKGDVLPVLLSGNIVLIFGIIFKVSDTKI